MTLNDLATACVRARDAYDELYDQLQQAKARRDFAEEQLLAAMRDQEMDSFRSAAGVSFSMQRKTDYSCLAQDRALLLELLEADGYRDMFTVNSQSLNRLMNEMAENDEEGELPAEYREIMRRNERTTLSVRGRTRR